MSSNIDVKLWKLKNYGLRERILQSLQDCEKSRKSNVLKNSCVCSAFEILYNYSFVKFETIEGNSVAFSKYERRFLIFSYKLLNTSILVSENSESYNRAILSYGQLKPYTVTYEWKFYYSFVILWKVKKKQ